MIPTRDSNAWWWVIAVSFVTAISSRLELIDPLVPAAYHEQVHAIIELLAMGAATWSGVQRMSKRPISDEGRRKAIKRDTGHLPKASVAAAVANVAAKEAVEATTEAAKKAEVAKDLAKG